MLSGFESRLHHLPAVPFHKRDRFAVSQLSHSPSGASNSIVYLTGVAGFGEYLLIEEVKQPHPRVLNILSYVCTFTQPPQWSFKTENPFMSPDCLKYSGAACRKGNETQTVHHGHLESGPCLALHTHLSPFACPWSCAPDTLVPSLLLKDTKVSFSAAGSFLGPPFPQTSDTS